MEQKNKIAHFGKIGIGLGILVCLWVPMMVQYRTIEPYMPLKGDIVESPKPELSWNNWCNEVFQKETESWVNQNFGYRNVFVRFNNQWHYWLFNTARANGVIIGKEKYLYEEAYIHAVTGTNFIGEKEISDITAKVKKIQDTLSKKNILFLVWLAPGKASFFPEYVPDKYWTTKNPKTNYAAFVNAFKKQQVEYLDFHRWFLSMKKSSKYPLFGQGGIHWSYYGEFLATDSLMKYIEQRKKVTLPKLVLDKIEISEKNIERDNDIGEGMNLLFENPTYPMAYPKFHVQKDSSLPAQNLLMIADSYYWGIFNAGISRDVFNNGRFWFYNRAIYPDSYEKPIDVSEINLRQHIEKNQIVILLQTDATLPRFGFGLIENLYKVYFPE